MDVQAYQVSYIIKLYTCQIKSEQIHEKDLSIPLNAFDNALTLSAEGKRKQLIDQLISEAVIRLTSCIYERKEIRLGENITHDTFPESGRRKFYGTLI